MGCKSKSKKARRGVKREAKLGWQRVGGQGRRQAEADGAWSAGQKRVGAALGKQAAETAVHRRGQRLR